MKSRRNPVKSERINIRSTTAEKHQLAAAAVAEGESLSDFILNAALWRAEQVSERDRPQSNARPAR